MKMDHPHQILLNEIIITCKFVQLSIVQCHDHIDEDDNIVTVNDFSYE